MGTTAFEIPNPAEVNNLLVMGMNETSLKPESHVYCVNRGRTTLPVTYNGEHLMVPPGEFLTEYGAALHMQKHLIVPGTRNLEVGGFISWIAIKGSIDGRIAVDPIETHQPFSDEELAGFGEKIEAIERGAHEGLTTVRVSSARAMSRSQGVGGLRPQISATEQATPAAAEAAAHVFDPPAVSETQIAEREVHSSSNDTGSVMPEPRPMRRK